MTTPGRNRTLGVLGRTTVVVLFFIGIILFSGTLYLLAITGIKWFGAITPIGGVAFLFGWFWLVCVLIKGHF